jgi:hypothetical protein
MALHDFIHVFFSGRARFKAQSSAALRSAQAFASCNQRSLSATTVAVRVIQTPGSLFWSRTCLPENCLPNEIYPFASMTVREK